MYKIYYTRSLMEANEETIIKDFGEASTKEEVKNLIDEVLKYHKVDYPNFKYYYSRYIIHNDGERIGIDFGSHTKFIMITGTKEDIDNFLK